jgi:hypothetical protein
MAGCISIKTGVCGYVHKSWLYLGQDKGVSVLSVCI